MPACPSLPVRRGPAPRLSLSLLASAAVLSACGGGGGGSDTAVVETPQSSGGSSDALSSGAGVFHFKVSEALSSEEAISAVTGGSTFAAWNPSSNSQLLAAGMKVTFFGKASGCPNTRNGTVDEGDDSDLRAAVSASTIEASSGALRRWTPSGLSAGCSQAAQPLSGPSMTFLNPAASGGALVLYTHTGPRSDGSTGLMAPFDSTGQNGAGANAHISGSFAAFRQDWRASTAITPWVGLKAATNAEARIVTTQGVGLSSLGSTATDQVVQAKQQLSVSFINTQCMAEGNSSQRPCQLIYLFNTAVYRLGVDDWSSVSWFQNGKVWFDPAQGGVPVVDLPIKASGSTVQDGDSGLALFVSKGAATQHASFSDATFDMRISFAQLANVLRIVSARKAGTTPDLVTDEQLAADWGSQWNTRSSWKLLSGTLGQEVHNPEAARKAVIGGSVKQLYIAPQG